VSLHLDPATTATAVATELNPYLEEPFAATHVERTIAGLELLEGELPDDLNGVYVRNGPNPQHEPVGRYHWFDGDGMVHAVHIADGQATYRNRWIRTAGFERERAVGRPLWTGIMEPFADNPKDAREKDTANTDVVFHHDRLLATWYRCGEPVALDPVTLETIGPDDFGGALRCEVSAHAKVDDRTGELMFFDYGPEPPYLRYGVVGPDGAMTHFTAVGLPGPRLPHDMAITEHHSILMDLPLIASPAAAARGRHVLEFARDLPSRFGVIPRHGAGEEIRWFEASPCYIYHAINAWEEGDEIVLDVCRVKQPRPIPGYSGPLAQMLTYLRLDAHVHRYRFDLRTGQTREQVVDDSNTEFPAINAAVNGYDSRYAYTMGIAAGEATLRFDALMKYDLKGEGAGRFDRYEFGPARWGSEASFAPRPHAQTEDDGYLVTFVRDEREDRSEVVVLDAADPVAGPVCRLAVPAKVPLGFHATWVPGDRLPGGTA